MTHSLAMASGPGEHRGGIAETQGSDLCTPWQRTLGLGQPQEAYNLAWGPWSAQAERPQGCSEIFQEFLQTVGRGERDERKTGPGLRVGIPFHE